MTEKNDHDNKIIDDNNLSAFSTDTEPVTSVLEDFDPEKLPISSSRKDLQLGRRLFHMFNGVIVATAYKRFFSHEQAVNLLGACACLVYLFEQIRISYPELTRKASWIMKFFLRAEEQIKESSMIPYVMAILLSIITFPKSVALIAIYTLAIADPLSAIIGIKFGKHHLVKEKSIEGTMTFFGICFLCSFGILYQGDTSLFLTTIIASILIAGSSAIVEMLPIKLDDNFTIPLSVGLSAWLFCSIMEIPFPL